MTYKSDIEIAQAATLRPIEEVSAKLGIQKEDIEHYGPYKAKLAKQVKVDGKQGKLILVTAITPTPAGEGKTTTTIGLADGLSRIGKKAAVALREPSLGPVFGVKGGAAGGGYAQVIPMEDLNLHFTGDFHAIGAANNLIAAMIDNHIHQGNVLRIDPRRIIWRRCVDMNDRELRNIVCGLGRRADGFPRQDGFDITVASEVMAAFCLAASLEDLKERLGRMIVAFDEDKKAVTVDQLHAAGAVTALLKDAFKPNIVQTLEGTPAFVHGGPFANIAHGCNSLVATQTALALSDYVVTEAGFGADLGAEKFIDIKCRSAKMAPDAVVLVATIRALKMHGGLPKNALGEENLEALELGMSNLLQHLENLTEVFGAEVVVAMNRFPTDTEKEIARLKELCLAKGADMIVSEGWAKGSEGTEELAKKVVALCDHPTKVSYAYELDDSIEEKIRKIAKRVYRADDVVFTAPAKRQIQEAEALGFGKLPICMAKTQYSFSDQAGLIAAPRNFEITVRNLRVSAGAGFLVALTGDIMTMPGLPKQPSAEKIDVDADGRISGLF